MIDFTEAYDTIGKIMVQGLSRRMKQQTGIDGEAYSPVKPSTLAKRRLGNKMSHLRGRSLKQRNKLKSSQSTKRLVVTGELTNEAFGYEVKKDGVRVFAREVSHMDGLSYAQILRYNSRGQKNVNKYIDRPPLVFPTSPAEIAMMDKENKDASRIAKNVLDKEIKRMKEAGAATIKRILTIG